MVKSSQDIGIELCPSTKLVVVLLMGTALVISLSSDTWLGSSGWMKVLLFALLLYVVAGVIWVLADWQPVVGQWVAIISLVAIINLGLIWLDVPGFVALIPIPIAVAAALIGLSAAVVTAIGQTVLFC